MKIGTGLVHQRDFAEALEAENLSGKMPKDPTNVRVVVGKLLGGRKPALLIAAEKKNLPMTTVDELLTPDVVTRLADVLAKKIKREGYESRALEALTSAIVPSRTAAVPQSKRLDGEVLAGIFPMPPQRGKGRKGKKVVA